MTQVQPRPFNSSWKAVVDQQGSNPAIYAGDGSVLRNFQDIESERDLYLDPDAVRSEYQSKLAEHGAAVEKICRRLGMSQPGHPEKNDRT